MTISLLGMRPASAIANILARARSGAVAGSARDGRKLALVVEGGAMRGVFSCGADAGLEALGLTRVFDEVYACSAGAINAAYFLSGQAAYGVTIYYEDINNRNFINPWRLNRILDLDFLFDRVICDRKPLQVDKVLASPSRLLISITDARTGAGFLAEAQSSPFALLDLLRASATHPLLSEPMMLLGDRECFDGGFANPLPIEDAIDNGCTDVLVFLTRAADYVDPAPGFLLREIFRWRCARGNPQLVEAGRRLHVRENLSRDLALGRRLPPPGVNIVAICPGEHANRIGRTTKSTARLKAAAAEGACSTCRRSAVRPVAWPKCGNISGSEGSAKARCASSASVAGLLPPGSRQSAHGTLVTIQVAEHRELSFPVGLLEQFCLGRESVDLA
jgi:predicted patatin/cPLA2 family phospholipase